MNDLQYFLQILECLRLKSEEYNLRAISEGPSTEYTFGFLFGEYNRKDSLILSAVEIININKDKNFLNYVSSALNFCFQEKIMESKNKIASYQNDLNCHKKLPEWKPNYSEC